MLNLIATGIGLSSALIIVPLKTLPPPLPPPNTLEKSISILPSGRAKTAEGVGVLEALNTGRVDALADTLRVMIQVSTKEFIYIYGKTQSILQMAATLT